MDPGKYNRISLILATILVTFGGFFVFQNQALAAVGVNEQINFQGKLVNTDGTNIADGTYNMEFKIYQDGDGVPGGGDETLKWTEDRLRNNSQGVVVADGIFQVNLGSVTAFSGIDWNQSVLWVSINVGNTNATCTPFSNCVPDGEMNPMVRFTAAPYAMNADKLAGKTWEAPGAIGSGTPNTGAFTTLGSNSTTTLSSTAGSTFTIGNSTGTGTIVSGGVSSWANTEGNLTISTATSGTLVLTSAGALNLTGAAASYFNTSAGDISFQVAGTGTIGTLQIGAGGAGSATPDLLGLDVKSTTSDPAGGFEGAMYYNTYDNKFRCYQGSGWTDCIGTGGAGPWTDGTGITYLTDTAEDFAVGANSLVAPFSVDIDLQTVRIGKGSTANGILNMYASDGDIGSLEYTANDSWYFNGGNVGIGLVSPSAKLDIDYDETTATAGNYYGLRSDSDSTGIFTTGTTNYYGIYGDATASGVSTGGTVNTYGGYFTAAGEATGAATTNAYGLYVNGATGADNNYSAAFMNGNVGIGTENPTKKLSVLGSIFLNSVPAPGACTAALAGVPGNVDNGTHRYKVTFVTADGETTLSSTSNVVTVTDKTVDGQVNLTNIPTAPADQGVTQRKIYRTKAETGMYYLLTTIADNTTTTYLDNTADANLGAYESSFRGNTTAWIYSDDGKAMLLGHFNTIVGYNAFNSDFIGFYNSVLGIEALNANTTGSDNSAVGTYALNHNTTGSYNSVLGDSALYYTQTGSNNTAFGGRAGYGTSGNSFSNNSLFGYQSGYALTTGSNNILLGYKAGDNLTTGANNLLIGYDIDAQSATGSSQLSIGNLIFGTGGFGTGTTIGTGNIGIGDASPDSRLDILSSGAANTYLKIANTDATNTYDSGIQFELDSEGTVKFTMGVDNSDSEKFKISTTALGTSDRLVIDSTGNVGIGTASPGANLHVQQTATATGALKGIIYTGAVNTNQTASTEIPSLTLTTAGREWATGALATQREVLITAPAYSFVGASTITDAATLGIAGAPIQSTNATITNTHGLLIQAGAVSTATNSYGLTVNAQTGATNNYAAAFLGGNVGIGVTGPTAFLDIKAATTDAASLRIEASAAVNPSAPNIGDMWFNGTNLYFRKDVSTSQDLLAGGNPTVSLAPSSADLESSANPTIWVNDTGGGDLMRLQKSGVNRFVVANSGGLTVNGTDNNVVRTTTADFTSGAQTTNLVTTNDQLELDNGTVSGDGTITTAGQPPVNAAIGAGSSTISRADGKYLVINGGGTATSVYNSLASTFTASTALTNATGLGSLALPRAHGGMYVVIAGGAALTTTNIDPMMVVAPSNGPALTAAASLGTVAFRRNDGRFLVTLGLGAGTTNIYDPILNTFVAGPINSGGVTWGIGSLVLPRPNGDALIITGGAAATTQNYTAMTGTVTGAGPGGTFAVGPALPTGCEINNAGSVAIRKSDGKYIVLSKINVSAIYDPITNTWSQNAGSCTTPTVGRGPTVALDDGAHAIPLQDGRYLVIHGGALTSTSVYDQQTDLFTTGPTITAGGAGRHSIITTDGTWRLIAGGGTATNKYDTQLVMTGIYRSDDISTSNLNPNSTLRWTRESEVAFTGIGQGAGGPGVFTATESAGGGSCTAGLHSYRVTFMINGVETYGGPASNEVTCVGDTDKVVLTNIPIGPVGTTARRVYRIGAASGFTSYKLVNGGSPTCVLSDNTTTTCTDTLADASLTTTVAGQSGAGAASTVQFFVRTAVNSAGCATPLDNAQDKEITALNDFIRPASEDNCIRVTAKFNRTLPKCIVDERERGTFTGSSSTVLRLDYATPTLFDVTIDNSNVLRRSGITFNFPLPNSEFIGLAGAPPAALTAGAPSAGGSCTAGTHIWKYTYITGGQESVPSPVSAMQTCTGGNGTVALSGITTGPTGTTARKVYRTFANGTSQYYLLTTINDNVTTTFNDTLADSALTSAIPGLEPSGPTFSRVESTADKLYLPYGWIAPTILAAGNIPYYLGGPTATAAWSAAHPSLPQAQTNAGTIVIARPNKTFKIIAALTTGAANGAIYDPASEQFSALQAAPNIPTAANGAGGFAIKRPDGKFLVVLGNATAVTNIYDPVNDTFVAGPSLPSGVAANGASAIPNTDGTFTIVQGATAVNGATGATVSAIYDPVRNTMTAGPTLTTGSNSGFAAIPLRNGMYKILPGADSCDAGAVTPGITTTMNYNPRTKVFSAGEALATTLVGCGAYVFQRPDGWWEIIAGESNAAGQNTTNLIHPDSGKSSITAPMTTNYNGEGGLMIPRPDGTFWALNGNNLATTNIIIPVGETAAAGADSGASQIGFAPLGPVLSTATGPGSVAFQRPDGKYVVINGNATATTQLIDVGWYADGQYLSEHMNVPALAANSTLEWKQTADSHVKMEVRAASSQAALQRAAFTSVGKPGQSFYNTGGETWVQVEVNMRREFPTWSGNLDDTYNSGGGMVFPYRYIPIPTLYSYQINNGMDLLTLQSGGSNVLRVTSNGGIYSSQQGGFFAGGADLAENYTSPDALEKGEIVSVDPADNHNVKRATMPYQRDLLGVVSTAPGFVAGSYTEGSFPIALVGRVPVNVTNENGMIKDGDRITSGSIPGYGMRATGAGRVIGVAMESMEPSQLKTCANPSPYNANAKCGQIMVFVNLTDYSGMPVETLMAEIKDDSVSVDGDIITSASNLDSPFAQFTAQAKVLNFLKNLKEKQASYGGSDILTNNVNAAGQVVSPLIVADTLVAKNIKAENIEGLQFIQTGLNNAQTGVENNTTEVKSLGQQITDLQGIVKSLNGKSDGLDASAVKELATDGGLTVGGPAEFKGVAIFRAITEFFDKVIFRNNVEFAGTATFNKDTAGYAIIAEGQEKIEVVFEKEYETVPIINASLSLQQIKDEEVRKAAEELLLVSDVKFIITNVTAKGFEIKINQAALSDIPFSWQAMAVKDAKTFSQDNQDNNASQTQSDQAPANNNASAVSAQDAIVQIAPIAPNENPPVVPPASALTNEQSKILPDTTVSDTTTANISTENTITGSTTN